jgi:hypothetical protein
MYYFCIKLIINCEELKMKKSTKEEYAEETRVYTEEECAENIRAYTEAKEKEYAEENSKVYTKEECQAELSKFTEEDFKNPTPGMKNSLWYKIAYAEWAEKNGLCLTFDSAEEFLEYMYRDQDRE